MTVHEFTFRCPCGNVFKKKQHEVREEREGSIDDMIVINIYAKCHACGKEVQW